MQPLVCAASGRLTAAAKFGQYLLRPHVLPAMPSHSYEIVSTLVAFSIYVDGKCLAIHNEGNDPDHRYIQRCEIISRTKLAPPPHAAGLTASLNSNFQISILAILARMALGWHIDL